jgi:hypothetical protein
MQCEKTFIVEKTSKYCMIPPTGGIQNDFNIFDGYWGILVNNKEI